MSALKRAIKQIGLSEMAGGLGVSAQRLANWASRGVPAEHCIEIERYTKKVGFPVLCEEMRPDIDWSYLRQMKASKTASHSAKEA